jgi:hypothetical protein
MPTFGTPTIASVLPDGDLLENSTRIDARRCLGTRSEARRVRPLPRPAGSVA